MRAGCRSGRRWNVAMEPGCAGAAGARALGNEIGKEEFLF
jgi:hypothetical protein